MDPRYAKLRMAALAASACLAVLYVMSAAMAPHRDRASALVAMVACAAYGLFRAVNGESRRGLARQWTVYHGSPMRWVEGVRQAMNAAAAWAAMDSMWMALDITACLCWGIPGVMAALFQILFLAAFQAVPGVRPDLYADAEHAQSMDLLESILYAQACAALALYAWLAG